VPDITAARPTSGTPIETAWGDQVHDALEGLQSGNASVVFASTAVAVLRVTFPRAYTVPPVVVVTPISTGGTHYGYVGAVTTTYADVGIATRTGTAVSGTVVACWIATGTPA